MPQALQVSLDEKGCITLPRDSRERLGLLPGMTLRVEQSEDDQLHLRIVRETPPMVEEEGFLVAAGEPFDDISDAVQGDRERRLVSLWGRGES